MSINFVTRAVQIPFGGSAIQEVLAGSASLVGRIGRAAEYLLPDTPNIFDGSFPKTLVGRAILLTAIGLSIASFIAHYKAHPPQSSEGKKSLLISSLEIPAIAFSYAWLFGDNLFLSVFVIDSVVQFKNALPYLNAPSSESSQIQRVIQVAYNGIKYFALTRLAIGVFRSFNRDRVFGVFYLAQGAVLCLFTYLTVKARRYPKTNLENVVGRDLGSHIATMLSLVAIASGIGGSLLYTGGLSCISAILNRNVYDCLYGARNISLAAFILPFIKKLIYHQHLLCQYSREFIQRFSLAVYRVKDRLEESDIKYSHFDNAYHLAFGYSVQKNNPEQKQALIAILKSIPAEEKGVCFYENQPFLDEQEMQEFIEACGIQAWDIWFYLNPEQFQRLFLPKNIAHFLNANGLQAMQAEVEALKNDLMSAAKSYANVEKEQKERQIYEEIQQEQKKIAEYCSSIYALDYVLRRIDPEKAISPGMRQYATELKNLAPQIVILKEKIEELESLIEEHTGDLTTAVPEAVGGKGCRVRDCEEILETFQIPSEQPFEKLSQLLVERGVKNQYDLFKNGIFVLADDLGKFKERLIDFLLRSDQPLQPVLAPVQQPLAASEIARVAEKIYKYAAIPFFYVIQFYTQLGWSVAGAAGGAIAWSLLENNETFVTYQAVLAIPELELYDGPNSNKMLYIFLSAQLTLCYFTRFGFIPAFSLGSVLGPRVYIYINNIRGVQSV
jgi:hypothetical protein